MNIAGMTFRRFIAALLMAALTALAGAAGYDFGDRYAAVAYSPSTGKCGYAWNQASRRAAEAAAMSEVDARDAKIVGWVTKGWLVLVVGGDFSYGVGWRFGSGAQLNTATKRALDECLKRTGTIRKIIRLGSGDFPPQVVSWDPPVGPEKVRFGTK